MTENNEKSGIYKTGDTDRFPPLGEGMTEGSEKCAKCEKCGLYETCNTYRLPMTRGSESRPRVLIIGEAPGSQEDILGKPFMGESGQLLRDCLDGILPRDLKVWITNAVKCRPPQNKISGVTPINCCSDFTMEDITTADPDIIVCCGATAYKQIGGVGAITSVRGRACTMNLCGRDRKVLPVFHPAYILRNVGSMGIWEQDLGQLRTLLRGKELELPKYRLVSCKEFISYAKDSGWFSYDIETNRELDFTKPQGFITVISCHTTFKGQNICFSIRCPHLAPEPDKEALRELFSMKDLEIVGHNIKFDLSWTKSKLGILPDNKLFDTQIAYSVLINEEASSSLKTLAYIYTDFGGYEQAMKDMDNDVPLGYSYDYYTSSLSEEYKRTLEEYNRYDTIATSLIYLNLKEKATEDMDLFKLLYGVFFKISRETVLIECNGAKLDMGLYNWYCEEVDKRLGIYYSKFIEEVEKFGLSSKVLVGKSKKPTPLNPNSSQQMVNLFYEKLKLPCLGKTKTGNPSVEQGIMEELLEFKLKKDDERLPILEAYISLKALGTIKSLFLNKFKEGLRDGYVYPRYSITKVDRDDYARVEAGGTVTTRLASANPNLQQVPGKFSEGGSSVGDVKAKTLKLINLQDLFISRFPDGLIGLADFSQIELRWAATLSGDEGMIDAYRTDKDLHKLTASQVFDVPFDEVTKIQRQRSKAVNFGIIYGQGAKAFAKDWGVPNSEASDFISKYFRVRSGLKKFIDSTRVELLKNGFVKDFFGKIRRLGNVWSKDSFMVEEAIRQGVNFKCQSSSAVMTLVSILRITERIREKGLKALVIGTVHDSILVDCPKEEREVIQGILLESMTNWDKLKLPVPIKADIGWADRWGSIDK